MSSYYEKILATGEVKCIDEEVPFDVPQGWEWERWGNIAQTIQYGYNAPALEHGVIKMVRISDIQENCVLWDNVPYCLIDENDIDTYLLKVNDILFARTGGTVGKSFLVEEVPEKAIYAGYLIRTRYSSLLNPRYMKSFMESQLYWEQLKNGTIATAQPNCNGKTLAKMLLPIPPTKEQDRIVEKLTQLSSFLDNYGLCQDRLNLLNEEIKEQLKKSILQEAIQGKLVPQLTEEGTAQDLLEQIKKEKLNLVKGGKLKKSALVTSVIFRGDDNKYYEKVGKKTVCIEDEVPFKIPGKWGWCRLRQICNMQAGKNISANKIFSEQSPSHHYKCIGGNGLRGFTDIYNVEGHYAIIGRQGALCGCVNIADGRFYATEHAVIVDTFNLISPNFMFYYLTALNLNKYATATAQPGLAVSKVMEILSPLPPLKEQQRIVAQIEKLFEQLR